MVSKDIEILVEKLKNKNSKIEVETQKPLIKNETNIQNETSPHSKKCDANSKQQYTTKDYPISIVHYNQVKTQTGKSLSDITLKNVTKNKVENKDFSISPKTLLIQSEIAYNDGKIQLSKNLKRAAEMVLIPDDELIKIYDMLRPKRSSENDLLNIASELKTKYNAIDTALLIKQACSVYKKRGLLINNE